MLLVGFFLPFVWRWLTMALGSLRCMSYLHALDGLCFWFLQSALVSYGSSDEMGAFKMALHRVWLL